MRVLGVDPGLRVTGYGALEFRGERAVLVEAGIIAPRAHARLEERLGELYDALRAVIHSVRPEIVVVEELWSSPRAPSTAILMGHARGVLCLAAHQGGIPVRTLGHALVKRVIVGSGSATKEQVKRMIVQRLELYAPPRPDDVSDALALALAFGGLAEREAKLERLGLATAGGSTG